MRIFVDDGSTNIKLGWSDNGEIKTLISANSFIQEWSWNLGDSAPANYEIDGERFSYNPTSPDAVRTTETRYQYSDVNVIAIHHALLQSGIAPQPIDIVVTLPLVEYLDTDNQPNKVNIERKKQNVRRAVQVQGGESFTIRKVSVLPESVPAGFNILKDLDALDSLLIIDLGGTTLDISHVRSKMSGITKTWCDSKIGVSMITESVKNALDVNASTRVSSLAADDLIINRRQVDYLTKRIPDAQHRAQVLSVMKEREKTLKHRVIDTVNRFSGYTHVMCVGGGADIVADAVQQATKVPVDRFYRSDDPQFDLVLGMIAMKG
ncbi:plasmid segregation protein ParM [Xenorhabdus sp. XENO-1]|uniref:plasmid segregation protein ParM n=1 Tax=Xenorhabdus bovienii TaxID=40576 RepID=UPI0020CA7E84|nr:plasmid segregation protein ParM [Xenorhabdus bovienii]MCP9269178.1 plasmid segregation protein ParM [Xenorhabdus bovienii subsp. africana]